MEQIKTKKADFKETDDDNDDDDDFPWSPVPKEKYKNYELLLPVTKLMEVETQLLSNFVPHTKGLAEFVSFNIHYNQGAVVGKFKYFVSADQKYSFKFLSDTERDFEGYITTLPPNAYKMKKCDIHRIGSVTYCVEYVSPIIPGDITSMLLWMDRI